jgi:hypothetical protein
MANFIRPALLASCTAVCLTSGAMGQNPLGQPRPEDTEIWTPVPRAVAVPHSGIPIRAPSDAIVLFDGAGLDAWVSASDGSPAGWIVADSVMTVNKMAGDIRTKRSFRDFQIHIEWRIPEAISGEGQARGNSGLFLATAGTGYELQILDSYRNETYVNGMAGSVYKQSIPLVNASLPPGQWQTYDVVWRAPRFDASGLLVSPARMTVFFNGILVQDNFELLGETRYRGAPDYSPYESSPVLLQAHQDPSPPISFRNIWLRELQDELPEASGAADEQAAQRSSRRESSYCSAGGAAGQARR